METLVNTVNQEIPTGNISPTNIKSISPAGMFSFLNKFKENKLYLFIVIGIIICSAVLYYLFLKNKEKKEAKSLKKNLLNVVNPNEKQENKLLFNPVDKQYYSLDASGNPVKTTLEAYEKQNKPSQNIPPQQLAQQQLAQQQLAQQQMAQQQMAQQQMAQQQMAQQQMAQQQMAQQQMAQQKAQQQKAQQQKAQQEMAQQQKAQQNNKLKHQVVSSSEDTSEDIEYDMNEVDNNPNISQFNLNSDDINELNEKLSENS